MPEYKVTYEIELNAASHEDAARTVARWQRDHESMPPTLCVTKEDESTSYAIDTGELPDGSWMVFSADNKPISMQKLWADAVICAEDINGRVEFVKD